MCSTSLEKGLTQEERSKRLKKYGGNAPKPRSREEKKHPQFRLKKKKQTLVSVIEEGRRENVAPSSLVPGDVIYLRKGGMFFFLVD